MKCMKCGRDAFACTTNEAIDTAYGLLIIKNIPCYKCEECDEIFYTGDVVQKIERITAFFEDAMQEIVVVDYEKAA